MQNERLGARLTPFIPETWVLGCIGFETESDSDDRIAKVVSALIQEARNQGAKRLEANPTLPWDADRAYRGSYEMYKKLGFEIHGRECDGSSEILLMSLTL